MWKTTSASSAWAWAPPMCKPPWRPCASAVVGTSGTLGADGKYTVTIAATAKAPFVIVAARSAASSETEKLVSVSAGPGNQTINVKPLRAAAGDTDVLVRTEVLGRGEPVQLDYRLEKSGDGWKIYNLNVLGVWLVETYRNQFSQEINARGIDGLIETLATRSKMPATPPSKG